MHDRSEQLLQKFVEPEVISQRLFEGKLPLEAFELKGPVVQYGEFTWQPVDTSKLPVLCPLSGRSTTIAFLEEGGSKCFAASVLPNVNNQVFASDTKVGSTLIDIASSNFKPYVLLGDEPDQNVNRTIAQILSRLRVNASELTVCQAEYTPAMHPIIKDGKLYTVDARIVKSMSTHQAVEAPLWAPIAIEP